MITQPCCTDTLGMPVPCGHPAPSRVEVGDDIEFLGVAHRIVRVEPYRHSSFLDEQWWIAYDAFGWSMTVTA